MKNDILYILNYLHGISDQNLLQYEFYHIFINFIIRFPWHFEISLCRLLLEDFFCSTQKKHVSEYVCKSSLKELRILLKCRKTFEKFLAVCYSSKNTGLPKGFWQLYFKNINFLTKTRRCLYADFYEFKTKMSGKDKQNHIFQKSKSYELSSGGIYFSEDREFIIHEFYWCIPLRHEIYTKSKKGSNLIKGVSSHNICSAIKSQHVKKNIYHSVPKTFDFSQNSSVLFHRVTFDHPISCAVLIDKPNESCQNSKMFEKNATSTTKKSF